MRVTTSTSPLRRKSSSSCSSLRPALSPPLRFSARMTLQPAARSFSSWSVRSWSVVLTRASAAPGRLLIIGASFIMARGLGIDLSQLARGETGLGRLAGAAIGIVLLAMLADFAWHVAKTAIDRHIYFAGR